MRVMAILVLAAACSSNGGKDLMPPPPGNGGGAGGQGGRASSGDGGAGQSGDGAAGAGGAIDASIARDGSGDLAPPVFEVASNSDGGGPGGPSLCPGSKFAVCESFEDTAIGAVPTTWNRRQGYGGKLMGVVADESIRGFRSLRIQGGVNGSQFIEYTSNLGTLATSHWGRIFFKVQTPAPFPATGVLHGDIVQHIGPRPSGGGTNYVRWGIVENTGMQFQWIYNVQTSQGPEFGDGTAYNYTWPGTWQCLEWRFDQPSQQAALYVDGALIPIAVGKSHAPEIPVFNSLGVGWANYQNAPGEGFVVWIDEVAFDPQRIGCER